MSKNTKSTKSAPKASSKKQPVKATTVVNDKAERLAVIAQKAEVARALELQAKGAVLASPEPAISQGAKDEIAALVSGAIATHALVKAPSAPMVHKSSIESPSKTVWAIADMMFASNPSTRRCDVIKECLRVGIATYTARTQYQRWYTARKASSVPAVVAKVITK